MLEKSFPKSFYYYFVDDYSELVKDISDISFSDCVLGDAQGAQTRVKALLSLLQRVEALSSRTRLQQLHPSQAVQCGVPAVLQSLNVLPIETARYISK